MISRKDNLLLRPWQQRKFAYHRQKVQSALPAIDTGPPPFRAHVCIKLKKQQKEKERSQKIEQDNYLLMQRLNYVTRTSRVDNMWRTPQPNFLNRVAMYETVLPEMNDLIALDLVDVEEDCKVKTRKNKCYACSPEKNKIEEPKIPEERVPWEPDKKAVYRLRSKSVPLRKSQSLLPSIKEQPKISASKPSSSKSTRLKVDPFSKKTNSEKILSANEPHNIVFSRGCLNLSINFPSDTTVKFQKGTIEKFLMRGVCHCKNSPAHIL